MNLSIIDDINESFDRCFSNTDTFKEARYTSDISKDISDTITKDIPKYLKSLFTGQQQVSKFKVKGSVGVGRATKTPWIAILDKGITTSTREGVYIVFLFSSDYKHVYITLNQGTTVPGLFGPRLGKKEIANNSKQIRNLLNISDTILKTDGNADIADDRYRVGSIYYTLWNTKDSQEGEKILNLYLSIYKKYKELLNTIQDSPAPSSSTNPAQKEMTHASFSISSIIEAIQSTGLIYSETLIKRLTYSLMAKPFVILSGLAGSGKTQLALAFAKCLSEDIEEQVCTVSIGADWTNREPLLGYPNALARDEYVQPESGILQLLLRANADPSKPYFLILDEMNLSVVERYFADFLSAMESGEPIKLWDNEEDDVPSEIVLPKNVFIIGTINVDETTYMFSPKVLDRANVIEFKIADDEMEKYLGEKVNINMRNAYSTCADIAADFVKKAKSQVEKNEKNKEVLLSFFKELKRVHAEFGYRTVNEISRYIQFASGNLDDDVAIDTAILQKLLPKLHGSRKKLVPVLTAMWQLCQKNNTSIDINGEFNQDSFKYPESAEKIQRMYNTVIDNGFSSFAEA